MLCIVGWQNNTVKLEENIFLERIFVNKKQIFFFNNDMHALDHHNIFVKYKIQFFNNMYVFDHDNKSFLNLKF